MLYRVAKLAKSFEGILCILQFWEDSSLVITSLEVLLKSNKKSFVPISCHLIEKIKKTRNSKNAESLVFIGFIHMAPRGLEPPTHGLGN
ncbi:hypothetical protein ACFTQ8_15485, partial [Heyndrickxia sporothermodurans]|uniref:hypothetical protein n=1 Tax=Heyndrickxia sporothermodurans TaxID=46224 RepID=UPI00363B97CB